MNTSILLSTNKEKAEAQRIFNEIAVEKLNLIRLAFTRLKIGDLALKDIESIRTGDSRGVIKNKLISKIKDTHVAGLPIKAEKAIDLLELDSTEFELAVSEFCDWCRIEVSNSRMSGATIEVSQQFFKLSEKGFVVDDVQFEKWVETKCNQYTTNPTQVKVLKLTNQLCDVLNELLTIKADPATSRDNFSSRFTTETLKQNPSRLFEEQGLEQVVSFSQGKFEANRKFVVSH